MTYPNPQPSPARVDDAKIIEGIHLNGQMVGLCPNHFWHLSAFPGYGRVPCPICGKYYVKGEEK